MKIKQNPIKIEIYQELIILSSVDESLKINKALEINRIHIKLMEIEKT